MSHITLITKPSQGYTLLDSGREEKLERFGEIVLARPDPQALWEKRLGVQEWTKAHGRYERAGKEGEWIFKNQNPPAGGWQIEFGGFKFLIKPTSFKHTGLFPEQLTNWKWVSEILDSQKVLGSAPPLPDHFVQQESPSILNLFGYTGGATLSAAKAGAKVTHVDASKTAVAWARENAKLSGLDERPIRWISEDALKFVQREIKRGAKYDAIIMDPPAFGHGPAGELWKFEEDFLKMIKLCDELLSEKPLFVLINGYAAGYSPLAFAYNLEPFVKKYGGEIEYGDLLIEESTHSTSLGVSRTLPCGIFARWKI